MEGDVNWLIDQGCLMIPDEHFARQSHNVIAILSVLYRATTLINEHRQDVTKELAGFFEMSQQELITAMRKNLYSMAFDNLFRIGILGFRDFLYNNGRVSNRLSEYELYDTAWLGQIDPALILLEDTVSLQDVTIIEKHRVYYRQDVTLVVDGLEIRFLVADDSKVVRSSLAQTIEILGGKVLGEATTGSEAIEMFTRLRPNFVTMDLSMPGMSGIDAIQRILQIDPTVNIIVISGTDLKELRDQVFDLGVKIFIVKPFDPLQVAEIIGLLVL
jgi:two-component system chemotaxis response regulator CheY